MTNLVWSKAPYRREKLLALLALADWADDEGFCRVSFRHLAVKARVTKSAVVKILSQFQTDNAIILVSKGGGRGNSSVYKLLYQNWQKKPSKKGVAGLLFDDQKGIPATPFMELEKGIPTTPFMQKKKSVPTTPFSQEKGIPRLPFSDEKGIPTTPFSTEKGVVGADACKELNTHGVCVDISQVNLHTHGARSSGNSSGKNTLSLHSFETILAYTNRQKESGAKIDPVAVAMAREKDGKLDAVIDAELAKMAQQETARGAEMPGQPDSKLLERFKWAIGRTMNVQSFDIWFAPISELSRTESAIFLRVPSEVFKNWISGNYDEQIGEALEELGLTGFHVGFVI
jgi:hypothetical protein